MKHLQKRENVVKKQYLKKSVLFVSQRHKRNSDNKTNVTTDGLILLSFEGRRCHDFTHHIGIAE